MSEYILKTSNITKKYGKQLAVDGVNMHIKKGAIYGFIGRNGAGKTSFMKVISGLANPSGGDFSILGYSGKDLKKVRTRVGCLIENPGLHLDFSAFENVKTKCIANGVYKKEYVEELLDIVGLADVGKKKAQKFSLGMKQRLGIALALVGEPDLLVLDEPINGLDPQGIIEVRETIQKLNKERNMTILISSHILDELSKFATHYGIIHEGKLIEELTAEELMAKCSERIEIRLDNPSNAIPVIDGMGITNYKVVDKEHIQIFERIKESALINAELVKNGVYVSEIQICNEELEEYFMDLTGGAR